MIRAVPSVTYIVPVYEIAKGLDPSQSRNRKMLGLCSFSVFPVFPLRQVGLKFKHSKSSVMFISKLGNLSC